MKTLKYFSNEKLADGQRFNEKAAAERAFNVTAKYRVQSWLAEIAEISPGAGEALRDGFDKAAAMVLGDDERLDVEAGLGVCSEMADFLIDMKLDIEFELAEGAKDREARAKAGDGGADSEE